MRSAICRHVRVASDIARERTQNASFIKNQVVPSPIRQESSASWAPKRAPLISPQVAEGSSFPAQIYLIPSDQSNTDSNRQFAAFGMRWSGWFASTLEGWFTVLGSRPIHPRRPRSGYFSRLWGGVPSQGCTYMGYSQRDSSRSNSWPHNTLLSQARHLEAFSYSRRSTS